MSVRADPVLVRIYLSGRGVLVYEAKFSFCKVIHK